MPINTSPWILLSRREQIQSRMRLFCFPYAGGGASIYQTWQDMVPKEVLICPIQLPGRQTRLMELPYARLADLVAAIVVADLFDSRPFALFGHSMGALIAFELARELRRCGKPMPAALYIAACCAPQHAGAIKQISDLPRDEFIDALARHTNMSPESFSNEELIELMLPTLRADFSLCETYHYDEEEPLPIPIYVFGGIDDTDVTEEDLAGWRRQTCASFNLSMINGDHFLTETAREEFFLLMNVLL
ncbi:MAG: putative thioesterase [Chlorobi bacterium]|nr:putative thioesterase [Chlorobiota bacterium]